MLLDPSSSLCASDALKLGVKPACVLRCDRFGSRESWHRSQKTPVGRESTFPALLTQQTLAGSHL